MKIGNILPASISFANMGCGFAAIMCMFGDRFEFAGWLIIFATVLDVVDGKVARIVNSTSKFGGQLDSLADLVTFGLAPAVMVGRICTGVSPVIAWGFGFFFAVCAAIRLAKFSCETPPGDAIVMGGGPAAKDEAHGPAFTGLPSTCSGGAIASLVILNAYLHARFGTNVVLTFLPATTFVLAILMLSRIRYTHAKVFFTAKKHGKVPFILEIVSATIFFVLCPQVTAAAAFCCYSVSGLLSLLIGLVRGKVFSSSSSSRQADPV